MTTNYPVIVVVSIFAYGMGLLFGSIITTSIDNSSHNCSCEVK